MNPVKDIAIDADGLDECSVAVYRYFEELVSRSVLHTVRVNCNGPIQDCAATAADKAASFTTLRKPSAAGSCTARRDPCSRTIRSSSSSEG